MLKYGALPLTFVAQEEQTVSPTLGDDQLKQRPARRRHRPARGRRLLAALLPRARLRHRRQPAGLRRADLRRDLHPRQADRVRPLARRHRRLHRRRRHHRGLVRRLLRAAQGRDQGGPHPALARSTAPGCAPDARSCRPTRSPSSPRCILYFVSRRRGARLRLHARPVHPARRRRGVPVHPPADRPACRASGGSPAAARPASSGRTAASPSPPPAPPPAGTAPPSRPARPHAHPRRPDHGARPPALPR